MCWCLAQKIARPAPEWGWAATCDRVRLGRIRTRRPACDGPKGWNAAEDQEQAEGDQPPCRERSGGRGGIPRADGLVGPPQPPTRERRPPPLRGEAPKKAAHQRACR